MRMKKNTGFIIFLVLSVQTFAQQLIPRKELFAAPENLSPQISPSGNWVGWGNITEPNEKILIQSLAGDVVVDTLHLQATLVSWQWSFENSLIVQSKKANEYVLELVGVNQQKKLLYKAKEPMQILAASPLRPNEILVSVKDADYKLAGIYLINLSAGSSERVRSNIGFTHWYFNGNYELMAAMSASKTESKLYIFEGDQPVLFKDFAHHTLNLSGGKASFACGVSYDGRYLYFTDNETTDKAVLKSYAFADKKEEVIGAYTHANLIWQSATYAPATRYITSAAALYAKAERIFMDEEFKKDYAYLEGLGKGDPNVISMSLDSKKWIVRFNSGGPNRYFLYDVKNQTIRHIISENPTLDQYTFVQRSPIYVQTADSLTLPCQLFLPEGADANGDHIPDVPLPTIMYMHGGPWTGQYQNIWLSNRNLQLLANRGYAVVNTEFRGATDYGKNFFEKCFGEFGGKMQQDLMDIKDYLVTHQITDKNKVAVWGWSYGGYAVGYSLTQYPDAFACGISMYGVFDLEPFTEYLNWREWVANPETEDGKKIIYEKSPIYHVDRLKKPLLLTHGSKDATVPISQTDNFVKELNKKHKKFAYTIYPTEGHDYMLPESWISLWAYAESFLSKYVGGVCEPVGTDLDHPNFEWKQGEKLCYK
jgi:acetyl esterase/lipase